jgi:transcriptional antiterminator
MSVYTQLALFKLGLMFQDNQYLSIQTITEQLDVSPRTVRRYINTLRQDYNAPICKDHINEVYHLTKHWDMLGELKRKLRSNAR